MAFLTCFQKVAWIDTHGQDYYDALYEALYPDTGLVRITAVFTQGSAVIYPDTPINNLKAYLTVTGYYEDGTLKHISDYSLSGTLITGTSVITVLKEGKTTIFNVNWEVIKYKEERGIFGLFDKLTDKKYEFSGIDISYIEHFYTEKNIELDRSPLKYIVLAVINMRNIHDQNIEYKRIKRSLLDVLANIGALYSTFFSVFSFVFRYYSRNFDNFKIIKEILSNQTLVQYP